MVMANTVRLLCATIVVSMWWPGIDVDLEATMKATYNCSSFAIRDIEQWAFCNHYSKLGAVKGHLDKCASV